MKAVFLLLHGKINIILRYFFSVALFVSLLNRGSINSIFFLQGRRFILCHNNRKSLDAFETVWADDAVVDVGYSVLSELGLAA